MKDTEAASLTFVHLSINSLLTAARDMMHIDTDIGILELRIVFGPKLLSNDLTSLLQLYTNLSICALVFTLSVPLPCIVKSIRGDSLAGVFRVIGDAHRKRTGLY